MAQAKPSAPHTDLDQLGRMIRLPARPERAKWEVVTRANKNDWSLHAMVEMRASDISELLATGTKLPGPVLLPKSMVEWLPTGARETYANAKVVSGDQVEVDAVSIEPTPFISEKSPLKHGRVVVFERGSAVFVALFTM